ncbi:MAG: hypothetical protein IH946_02730 [Bacteroidetes bacterium]|nr:hypothetical protein [Bacteroidota bacterium]
MFRQFINRNNVFTQDIKVVVEDEYSIRGSYLMLDPSGRFFDDTKKRHTYSDPVLDVGVSTALNQVTYVKDKFLERGGDYYVDGDNNS